ncbi:MAG: hypothetical protein KatS3mg056_0076 [Chloroflexus sp.]|uniref:Transposase IS701-like DDE domain-containing protein n=1 Tax=Chloroflexus aurantiacus (strain ATCC 29366 / DSM 635 / J-10-fl) TaxID=324602 RepID=A9WFA9_CHLAA|nr:hypothetical protein Caur_2894 [Chloroflexus aurantiacus J-10-fl]GIV91367.1 MAG: hypothetical protein KatS3mg056_0076 [Chloroflexus sp.]
MPRKQSPTPTAMVPVVLATLMQIIAAHRPACRQERTFRRAVALLVGELVAFARHTVTQVLLALGKPDTDGTACSRLVSRSRFDEATLTAGLVRETLKRSSNYDPAVVGIDSTQTPRRRLTLPGTRWVHARRTWGWIRGPTRPERWWRGAQRWRFTTLWRSYRAALWGTAECRSLWTTSTDDWLKKRAHDHRPDQRRTRGGQGVGGPAAFSPPKRPIHQHATESHQHLLPTLVIPPASTKQPTSSAAAWLPHSKLRDTA